VRRAEAAADGQRFRERASLHVQGSKFIDSITVACNRKVVQIPRFTLTESGLSGANTMSAIRDVLDHPGDPEAESRLCAALALCRTVKSTEGVTSFKLTPIQKV